MVKSYHNPCLVYDPGKAPTKPPKPFRASPGTIVVPERPPKEPPESGGLEIPNDRNDEIISWSGALPYIYKPFAETQTTTYDAVAGENRLKPYNPSAHIAKSAQEEADESKAKRNSTYDPDYSFKKYDPSPLKSTLVRNTRNTVLAENIYEDFKLIERYKKGLQKADLFPIFNLKNQYHKLYDNLSIDFQELVDSLNFRDQQKFLDLVFESTITDKINTQDFEYRRTALTKRGLKVAPEVSGVNKVDKAYNHFQKNKYSIDPEQYDNLVQQKELQTFKCIPSDLNKRIAITSRSIGETQVVVNDDDSYILVQSDGTELIDYINDGDTIDVRLRSGEIKKKLITTDVHKAYYTSMDVLEDLYNIIGDEFRVDLTVETDTSSLVEMGYGLDSSLESYYLYELDNTSITNLAYETLGISKTQCTYTKQSNDSTFNDNNKFRAFPYLVLPVANDDPLLAHLDRSDDISTIFSDIDFTGFSDILPRRIPYHLIIVPTDSEKLNFYNLYSEVTTYTDSITKRKLSFTFSPDKKANPERLAHSYLTREFSYPGDNIVGLPDTQGIKYEFGLSKGLSDAQYVAGTEQLPRVGRGIRQFLKVSKSLTDNYDTTESLTWFDTLSRLSFVELYDLLMSNNRNIFYSFANTGIDGVKYSVSRRDFQTGLRELTGIDEYEVITQPYTL